MKFGPPTGWSSGGRLAPGSSVGTPRKITQSRIRPPDFLAERPLSLTPLLRSAGVDGIGPTAAVHRSVD